MKTAYEFWIERYGETPEYDSEKLAVAMMSEYGRDQWNAALDAAAEITDDHYIDEDENIYVSQSEILKLKK
jgi:hypothetical protein